MDFRHLITSNATSTVSSTMSSTGSIFSSSLQPIQLFNLFNILQQSQNYPLFPLRNPYMSEEEEKEIISYEENFELLKFHYTDITNTHADEIYEKYLKVINHLWLNNSKGDLPTLEEIGDYLLEHRCECTLAYTEEQTKDLLVHLFRNNIKDLCGYIRISVEYHLLNNRYPSLSEIIETMNRMRNFYNSPTDFHQNDKVEIGIKNIDKLKVSYMDKNEFKSDDSVCCSICQDEIKEQQKYVKLEPCGHLFHYSEEECLDGASVINWLRKNKFCPNCKTEVHDPSE